MLGPEARTKRNFGGQTRLANVSFSLFKGPVTYTISLHLAATTKIWAFAGFVTSCSPSIHPPLPWCSSAPGAQERVRNEFIEHVVPGVPVTPLGERPHQQETYLCLHARPGPVPRQYLGLKQVATRKFKGGCLSCLKKQHLSDRNKDGLVRAPDRLATTMPLNGVVDTGCLSRRNPTGTPGSATKRPRR